jgi:hypothetical protein
MIYSVKKRMNLVLSNGFCVLHAKIRDNNPVAILFITDYTYDTRVLFDMEQKRILTNPDNIEITAKDIDNIAAALK